jgi:integrase
MDVAAHIRGAEAAGKGPTGNRDAAVLGSVYRYAKECGLTEYNPCLGASRNPETPRDQEMHDEIFLELYEEASPVLQCLMDLDVMVGSRVSDLLKITEFDWTAAGLMAIPSKRKRGQAVKKQLFQRTADLEEVMARAALIKKRTLARDRDLPGYKPVKSTYLFVSGPEGDPYTESGFQSMMRATKARVARKRLAAAGVATPTPEQLLEAVRALDIHFHDGRARAGADAEKSGQNVAKFLGHTDDGKTARRHYLNRGVDVLTPNPRIKRG